jgi:hypothetical protein
MTTTRVLTATAVLALSAAVTPALAHDDSDSYYRRHARDHAEHRQFHYDVGRAHERAHEDGFYSHSEHRAYHRALRDQHRDFHEDHPGTRHDHYRRWW